MTQRGYLAEKMNVGIINGNNFADRVAKLESEAYVVLLSLDWALGFALYKVSSRNFLALIGASDLHRIHLLGTVSDKSELIKPERKRKLKAYRESIFY